MLALLLAALLSVSTTPAPTTADTYGIVLGGVARCVNGADVPSAIATVSIDGQPYVASTDVNGDFVLPAAPGTYTVTAHEGDSIGHRYYVPVTANETLDIGILELDPTAALQGCGDDG